MTSDDVDLALDIWPKSRGNCLVLNKDDIQTYYLLSTEISATILSIEPQDHPIHRDPVNGLVMSLRF